MSQPIKFPTEGSFQHFAPLDHETEELFYRCSLQMEHPRVVWTSLQVETAKPTWGFWKKNIPCMSWVPYISNSWYPSTTLPIIRQSPYQTRFPYSGSMNHGCPQLGFPKHTSNLVHWHSLPNWGKGKSLFNLWRELSRLRRTLLGENNMDNDILLIRKLCSCTGLISPPNFIASHPMVGGWTSSSTHA